MEKQKYYITTAIAYTSGKPHIGNTYEVFLPMLLPAINVSRAMMYSSRQELMSMARKSN